MTRPFELQGHRGARGLFPENTLEGFQRAMALGLTAFELDVGMTQDGVVVVTHDLALNPDIARTPDGLWIMPPPPLISHLTYDAVQSFDVGRLRPGSFYAARYPEQVPCDGARVPTLAQVLALRPAPRLNIEMKTDPRHPNDTATPARLAEAVLAEVDSAHAAGRIWIESFDWRGPRHVRRLRPDIPLAWLTRAETIRDATLWWDGTHPGDHGGSVPRTVAAEGGPYWAPAHEDLTRDQLAEAHDLELLVVPWTVNNPSDIRRLIRWGVDGLITDRPDLAWTVMRDEGLAAPDSTGAHR